MQTIKNYLYNVFYQMLTIILPLVTVPYISGVLGEKGVGEYSLTFANSKYFIIAGMIGISIYASREIACVRDDKEKLKNEFFSIYTLQLITTITATIVYVLFCIFFYEECYRGLYLAQTVNVVACVVDISWFFIGLEQFKRTVLRNTIVKLMSLLSIFVFVKNESDVAIYILIVGLSALIGNLTLWFYIPKEIEIKEIKISNLKYHLKSSLSLFIPQIAIQVYTLLDRTLLGTFCDIEQVGYYENSQKLIKIGMTLATTLGTVMLPKISNILEKGKMDEVKKYTNNSFMFVSAIAYPIVFGFMAISNNLVPWFYHGKFIGIEKLINVGALIVIPITWASILGVQLLIPLKRNKQYTISVTAGAVINFVLNMLLLKRMESLGACITSIIAECTVTSIQFYCVKDIIKPLKLIKSSLVFCIPSVFMYTCIKFTEPFLSCNIISTVVQVCVGVIVYLGILIFILKRRFNISIKTILKSVKEGEFI